MPELIEGSITEWLEARFQAAEDLYKEFHEKQVEHHAQCSHQQWESYLNRITELEQRIMSAINDLSAAVAADVEGRKALAASVAEIGTAVTGVSAFLQNNPAPGSEVIASLAQQLATAGTDLAASAVTLHSSAVTLEGLVPAPPVVDPAPPVVPVDPAPPVAPVDPSVPTAPVEQPAPPTDPAPVVPPADPAPVV